MICNDQSCTKTSGRGDRSKAEHNTKCILKFSRDQTHCFLNAIIKVIDIINTKRNTRKRKGERKGEWDIYRTMWNSLLWKGKGEVGWVGYGTETPGARRQNNVSTSAEIQIF